MPFYRIKHNPEVQSKRTPGTRPGFAKHGIKKKIKIKKLKPMTKENPQRSAGGAQRGEGGM